MKAGAMKRKVKGTRKQHRELDADYKRILDKLPDSPWTFWSKLAVMELWREEKVYLSNYGQRYPKITNVSA